MTPSAANSMLVTDELRDRYFSVGELVFRYTVPSQVAEQFAAVVGAHDGGTPDEARARAGWPPLALVASLDPFERKDVPDDGVLAAIPYPPTGGGNAFTEIDYLASLPINEEVTVVYRPTELTEKSGRGGQLLFRIRESEVLNAAGTVVARIRAGHVMAYDTSREEQG